VQYKNSPNAAAHIKKGGAGCRVEPFQRLSEVCTPDSLDSVCSAYEAYRSIMRQVEEAGIFYPILYAIFRTIGSFNV
jgi:hypothetical protein